MSNIYQLLTEPFPVEMERTLNKGGASLVYIPVSEVITRMNKIIGVENWSYQVKTWQQLGTSIVAHVTVTVEIDGKTITRDGVGGQRIKLTKNQEPLDIGDELKGAVSDALKKGNRWINFPAYILLFFFIFIVPAILLYVFYLQNKCYKIYQLSYSINT